MISYIYSTMADSSRKECLETNSRSNLVLWSIHSWLGCDLCTSSPELHWWILVESACCDKNFYFYGQYPQVVKHHEQVSELHFLYWYTWQPQRWRWKNCFCLAPEVGFAMTETPRVATSVHSKLCVWIRIGALCSFCHSAPELNSVIA